jgi:tetratricopeptide (TPR) repeat protein
MFSAAGILLLTLSVLTWRQCRIYADEHTLWSDTLNKNPDSWMAHTAISLKLFEQGKFEEAKYHAEQNIKLTSYLKTINPRKYADSYCLLANIFEAQGRLNDAVYYYQRSLEIYDNSSFTHYGFAAALDKQGNYEMAMVHLRRVVEIAKAEKITGLAEYCVQVMNLIEAKRKNPNNQKPEQWYIRPDYPKQ